MKSFMQFIATDAAPAVLAVANDADIDDAFAASLHGVASVALAFPKWTDGRAYSQAHLLRARYRYAGEIRATGDVVIDMLPLLQRTGFSSVQLRSDQDRASAERALAFFPDGHYQGDVTAPRPRFASTRLASTSGT